MSVLELNTAWHKRGAHQKMFFDVPLLWKNTSCRCSESPGVFQEMLDLIFNPCCGHTEINQKVPHKQLASAGVKWHKIALSDLFGAFWPNHYLWISSVEGGCRQGELTPVLPDQSAVDTSHCFKKVFPEGFLHFGKTTTTTTRFLEGFLITL